MHWHKNSAVITLTFECDICDMKATINPDFIDSCDPGLTAVLQFLWSFWIKHMWRFLKGKRHFTASVPLYTELANRYRDQPPDHALTFCQLTRRTA